MPNFVLSISQRSGPAKSPVKKIRRVEGLSVVTDINSSKND